MSNTLVSRWLKSQCAIAAIGVSLVGLQIPAQGQEAAKAVRLNFDSYALDDSMKDANTRKEKKRVKDEMLKGASAYNRQAVYDAYYKKFLLPLLTHVNVPEYGNIARREILEDIAFAEKSKNETVINEFNAMLLAEMKTIAKGNYIPSAAINATQILALLNKPRSKPNAMPEPLSEATNELYLLFRDGKNDGIRAAALYGLERHIELLQMTWDDHRKQQIGDAIFATLSTPKPPGRNLRTDAWIRGRTMELLLKFKHAKEAELYQYATNALANPKTDPILIEKAMLVTGQYPPSAAAPADLNSVLSNPLKYVVTRVNAWKKEAGEAQFLNVGGSGGAEGTEMNENEGASTVEDTGDGTDAPKKAKKKGEPKVNPYAKQPPDVVAKRRAMHELLEIFRYGYSGVKFGAATDTKSGLALVVPEGESREIIAEVITAMKDLQDTLNSPTIVDRATLVNEVTPKADAMISVIEFLLNRLQQPDTSTPPAVRSEPVAATN